MSKKSNFRDYPIDKYNPNPGTLSPIHKTYNKTHNTFNAQNITINFVQNDSGNEYIKLPPIRNIPEQVTLAPIRNPERLKSFNNEHKAQDLAYQKPAVMFGGAKVMGSGAQPTRAKKYFKKPVIPNEDYSGKTVSDFQQNFTLTGVKNSNINTPSDKADEFIRSGDKQTHVFVSVDPKNGTQTINGRNVTEEYLSSWHLVQEQSSSFTNPKTNSNNVLQHSREELDVQQNWNNQLQNLPSSREIAKTGGSQENTTYDEIPQCSTEEMESWASWATEQQQTQNNTTLWSWEEVKFHDLPNREEIEGIDGLISLETPQIDLSNQ